MAASTPIIYLVRHAESEHNVSKDVSHRDPPLTTKGLAQASALSTTFPSPEAVGTVISSPLTRALQTALAGFAHVITNAAGAETPTGASTGTPAGTGKGVRLVLDPDLQERSDLPCDTGSDAATLQKIFPQIDFSALKEGWYSKTGSYAADDEAVAKRAVLVREKLYGIVSGATTDEESGSLPNEKGNVVVVTHGAFMKFLAEDETIDLPKAGWKAYTAVKEGDGVQLVPV